MLTRPCIPHEIAVRKLMRKVDVVTLRKETADSVDVWAVAHHFRPGKSHGCSLISDSLRSPWPGQNTLVEEVRGAFLK